MVKRMKTNYLLYNTKIDIPFAEMGCSLHNPTVEEISLIGEREFHIAVEMVISIPKNLLDQGKAVSEDITDFDIFMTMINHQDYKEYKNCVLMLFSLLFVNCSIKVLKDHIEIIDENQAIHLLNKTNFEALQTTFIHMFKTEKEEKEMTKPADGLAKKIAEKIAAGKRKREEIKGKKNTTDTSDMSIYKRYASILAVGEQKDINILYKYTPKQLKEEFERYQKKIAFDNYVAARLAGATDIDEPENWME